MVRTLVFQSNNVGSIPADPILFYNTNTPLSSTLNSKQVLSNSYHLSYNIMHKASSLNNNVQVLKTKKFDIRYYFLFVSWVAPHIFFNYSRFFFQTNKSRIRIGIKKSYTILTWLYYLTFTLGRQTKNKSVTFSFLPKRRKMYTLTKAPMAHKTFSKEQFKFQLYTCKVSVSSFFAKENTLLSLEQLKTALLITKNTFPILETNLLFLKTCQILIRGSAVNFYSYSLFSSNKKIL